MSMTRGQILDRVQAILGDDSTPFRTYLEVSLENMLFSLFDMHDWEWKHKSGTFDTADGVESYDLSSAASDVRSSQDLEVLYDTTNGRFLRKVELNEIKRSYPKSDADGDPRYYAPWGPKSIFLHAIPNDAITMNFLYIAKASLPTLDTDDLEAVCGVPDYCQYLLEKMLLADGMLYIDDSRYQATLGVWTQFKKLAIAADMRHVDSNARFKFWEENLRDKYHSYHDFLREWWWGDQDF